MRISPGGEAIESKAGNLNALSAVNAESGKTEGQFEYDPYQCLGAAFLNETRLVSWGADGVFRIWDAHSSTATGSITIAEGSPLRQTAGEFGP